MIKNLTYLFFLLLPVLSFSQDQINPSMLQKKDSVEVDLGDTTAFGYPLLSDSIGFARWSNRYRMTEEGLLLIDADTIAVRAYVDGRKDLGWWTETNGGIRFLGNSTSQLNLFFDGNINSEIGQSISDLSNNLQSFTVGDNVLVQGTNNGGNISSFYRSFVQGLNNLSSFSGFTENNFVQGTFNLNQLTSGSRNFAQGHNNGKNLISGSDNFIAGRDNMLNGGISNFNIAIGIRNIYNTTNSQSNVAFGVDNLKGNLSGNHNFAVGTENLEALNSGSYNTAIGRKSLELLTTGSYNLAIGSDALGLINSGNYNVALGASVMKELNSGSDNFSIGISSGRGHTVGSKNIFIGYFAGTNLSIGATANTNIAIGNESLTNSLFYNRNIAIGDRSGFENKFDDVALFGNNAEAYKNDEVALGSDGYNRVRINPRDLTLTLPFKDSYIYKEDYFLNNSNTEGNKISGAWIRFSPMDTLTESSPDIFIQTGTNYNNINQSTGDITIKAGSARNSPAVAGDVLIEAGSSISTALAGSLTLKSGFQAFQELPENNAINILAGMAGSSGAGGNINIIAGGGVDGDGRHGAGGIYIAGGHRYASALFNEQTLGDIEMELGKDFYNLLRPARFDLYGYNDGSLSRLRFFSIIPDQFEPETIFENSDILFKRADLAAETNYFYVSDPLDNETLRKLPFDSVGVGFKNIDNVLNLGRLQIDQSTGNVGIDTVTNLPWYINGNSQQLGFHYNYRPDGNGASFNFGNSVAYNSYQDNFFAGLSITNTVSEKAQITMRGVDTTGGNNQWMTFLNRLNFDFPNQVWEMTWRSQTIENGTLFDTELMTIDGKSLKLTANGEFQTGNWDFASFQSTAGKTNYAIRLDTDGRFRLLPDPSGGGGTSDGYISNMVLNGNSLDVSRSGTNAFQGSIDFSQFESYFIDDSGKIRLKDNTDKLFITENLGDGFYAPKFLVTTNATVNSTSENIVASFNQEDFADNEGAKVGITLGDDVGGAAAIFAVNEEDAPTGLSQTGLSFAIDGGSSGATYKENMRISADGQLKLSAYDSGDFDLDTLSNEHMLTALDTSNNSVIRVPFQPFQISIFNSVSNLDTIAVDTINFKKSLTYQSKDVFVDHGLNQSISTFDSKLKFNAVQHTRRLVDSGSGEELIQSYQSSATILSIEDDFFQSGHSIDSEEYDIYALPDKSNTSTSFRSRVNTTEAELGYIENSTETNFIRATETSLEVFTNGEVPDKFDVVSSVGVGNEVKVQKPTYSIPLAYHGTPLAGSKSNIGANMPAGSTEIVKITAVLDATDGGSVGGGASISIVDFRGNVVYTGLSISTVGVETFLGLPVTYPVGFNGDVFFIRIDSINAGTMINGVYVNLVVQ